MFRSLPSWMVKIVSARLFASVSEWVMWRVVTCSVMIVSLINSKVSVWVLSSSPVSASSRQSRRGLEARARPIATLLASPPESEVTCRVRR